MTRLAVTLPLPADRTTMVRYVLNAATPIRIAKPSDMIAITMKKNPVNPSMISSAPNMDARVSACCSSLRSRSRRAKAGRKVATAQ